MMFDMDLFHNNIQQLKMALRFREFSRKLFQIRLAERRAKYFATAPFFSKPSLPRDIVIRVTEKCFLNCAFCAQGKEGGRVDRSNVKDDAIKIETLRKITDEISSWRIKPFVKFTGGEPLTMGTPLLDIIQEMRERKIVVKLNSNGMLLKNKKIAKRIAETDLNYLSISLDGGKEVHNRLRGNKNLFDSMMEGIDNVKEYRKELGKKNVMILVSMVISKENVDQMEEVYRIVNDKGIDWFNIQFLNYTTPETSELAHQYAKSHFNIDEAPWKFFCDTVYNQIDASQVEANIKKILSRRGSVPVSVLGGMRSGSLITKYYYTMEPIRKNICLIPFTGMHIVMPGKAMFCIDYPFYEYGDVREDSLESVWYGKKAADFRKDMIAFYKKNKKNYHQCQRCNWRFN